MLFMLSRRVKDNVWSQLGIVVADSIQEAANKIRIQIVGEGFVKAVGAWAELEDGYSLEEYGELKSLPVPRSEK